LSRSAHWRGTLNPTYVAAVAIADRRADDFASMPPEPHHRLWDEDPPDYGTPSISSTSPPICLSAPLL
jgi:hypothetical protein